MDLKSYIRRERGGFGERERERKLEVTRREKEER